MTSRLGTGKTINFLQCALYIESGENVINTSRYYWIHSHFPQSMGRLSQRHFIREYLREFSKKFEMVLMGFSEVWGKLISEKNLKLIISCQTPFKEN